MKSDQRGDIDMITLLIEPFKHLRSICVEPSYILDRLVSIADSLADYPAESRRNLRHGQFIAGQIHALSDMLVGMLKSYSDEFPRSSTASMCSGLSGLMAIVNVHFMMAACISSELKLNMKYTGRNADPFIKVSFRSRHRETERLDFTGK